jgi:anionic cell wall polymer biosynthesis LytR-Cps2A-Psr (LCP) family protein
VKPGKGRLDGLGAWEFIRFLDRQDARGLDVRGLEVVYDARRHRQQGMLRAMRSAFGQLDTEDQLKLIARIGELFQTNMDRKFVLSLYRNMLAVSEISFGTLPGYYSAEGDRLFFYPDIPGYRSLLKREIRSYLVAPGNRKQRVY